MYVNRFGIVYCTQLRLVLSLSLPLSLSRVYNNNNNERDRERRETRLSNRLTHVLTCTDCLRCFWTWFCPHCCSDCAACTCCRSRGRRPRIRVSGGSRARRCLPGARNPGPRKSRTPASCRWRNKSSPDCGCCAGLPEKRCPKPRPSILEVNKENKILMTALGLFKAAPPGGSNKSYVGHVT